MKSVNIVGVCILGIMLILGLGCKKEQTVEPAGQPGEPVQGGEEQVKAPDEPRQQEPQPDILEPSVGKVLAGVLKSQDVQGLLPEGWSVDSAGIEAREITIMLAGPNGAKGEIEFLPPDSGEGETGKWFSYKTSGGWDKIAAFANGVDSAFSKSPWTSPVRPPDAAKGKPEAEEEKPAETPEEGAEAGTGEGKPEEKTEEEKEAD